MSSVLIFVGRNGPVWLRVTREKEYLMSLLTDVSTT